MKPTIQLHEYQKYCVQFIKDHPGCGLFLSVGLGKSSTTLQALYELSIENKLPAGHVLIIAPRNIARSTWIDEIAKWNFPFRTQSLIVNEKGKKLSKAKRLELYSKVHQMEPTMFFINRELIPDLVKYFGTNWPFSTVVIDESQSFKSHSSERFKCLKKVRPYIHRMIELTGTPAPNGLMDLWAQIYLLDGGQRLGKNITAYRNKWFYPGRTINNYPVEWIPFPNTEKEIYEAISDIVISIKNTKLKLPPLTVNNVKAYMEEDQLKRYKDFMKTMVLPLSSGEEIAAANAAVLSAKLSQMASGAIYTDMPNSHDYEVIHTAKIEQCAYILNNTDSPVIIAYHFISDKDMLMKNLSEMGFHVEAFDGSPEMIKRWNKREIPVMLLQPASSGHGLNLQQGGHTLVWYTIPWSLEHYEQTNGRIYRQGQTEPVVIHHIITDNTIDSHILRTINKKHITQQDLLDAVVATINETE